MTTNDTTDRIDNVEIRFELNGNFETDPLWGDALRDDLNHWDDEAFNAQIADMDAFARQELNQANSYRRDEDKDEFGGCTIEVTLADGAVIEGSC
jgi:hypothetical protein